MKLNALFAVLAITLITGSIAQANDEPGNTVLLEYDGLKITEADFRNLVRAQIPEDIRKDFFADNEKVRQLVADLFVTQQLARESATTDIETRDSVQFMIKNARAKVLAEEYLRYTIENADTPDFEQIAREKYQATLEEYKYPEQVKASHILLRVNPDRDEAATEKLAQELASKAKGMSEKEFANLAEEYSEDQSVESNSGRLGFFAADRMVKEFADAAFAMTESGQISTPVKSVFGYHVIRYEDRKEAGTAPFEKVAEILKKEAQDDYERGIRIREIERVRSLDGIQINQIGVSDLSQSN